VLQKFLDSCEHILDSKLKNGTVMVLIISMLVIFTGGIVHTNAQVQ
jgi:hypothetical protein